MLNKQHLGSVDSPYN